MDRQKLMADLQGSDSFESFAASESGQALAGVELAANRERPFLKWLWDNREEIIELIGKLIGGSILPGSEPAA